MNPVAAALAGIVMTAALAWQLVLWNRWGMTESSDKAIAKKAETAFLTGLVLPIALAAIVAIGIVTMGVVSLADSQNTSFTLPVFFSYLGKAFVLVVLTAAKAGLGVLVAGYVVAAEIYFVFTYGSLRPVPLLTALLDWIFSFGPNWLGVVWLGSQVTWSVVTGAVFTFFDVKP
jgi:hypothetical protein